MRQSRSLRNSLRFRLAAIFACFGAFVSVILAAGLSIAAHDQSRELMDETLYAEIDDTHNRRARNPYALPPSTVSIHGYIFAKGNGTDGIPPELTRLSLGLHQLAISEIPYRVAVVDKGTQRYVMLFNEINQRQREEQFWIYWIAATLLMTLVAGGIGWWLSGRIVAPVIELSRRVGVARLEDEPEDIAKGFLDDEIGKLARAFGGYLKRMKSFSERERAFTADVSHELRTPLAIIQGAVELLEDDERLEERQRQRLARIDRAARQMVALTATLLILARESNDKEASEAQCDVADVVKDVVEAHRYLARPDVVLELACNAAPRIAAERSLLGIVVANLIRNALNYTERGKVFVLLDEHCLSVVDTGRGIPGEEIGKVFDRYFKGSESAGEGIGLSLVKRICDRHGWHIAIDSQADVGTTARLLFTREVNPEVRDLDAILTSP